VRGQRSGYPESDSQVAGNQQSLFHAKWWPGGLGDSWFGYQASFELSLFGSFWSKRGPALHRQICSPAFLPIRREIFPRKLKFFESLFENPEAEHGAGMHREPARWKRALRAWRRHPACGFGRHPCRQKRVFEQAPRLAKPPMNADQPRLQTLLRAPRRATRNAWRSGHGFAEASLDIANYRWGFSLAPGFSPVKTKDDAASRFNGLAQAGEAARAAGGSSAFDPPG
jgi:hypothetical protein